MDPVERPSPFVPVLCGWLVPGAGHLQLGRVWPGLFVFAGVLPLFVAGIALTGFDIVSPDRHPWWFWTCHVWGGLLSGSAAFLTRNVSVMQPPTDRTVGELFAGLACL